VEQMLVGHEQKAGNKEWARIIVMTDPGSRSA
jgi:hypothetical protein